MNAEAKPSPAELVARARADLAVAEANADRLRERLPALAPSSFDDAALTAARQKVENLAAAVALGYGKVGALRSAREALAREESVRDAHAAAAREMVEARAGLERMVADTDAARARAASALKQALREWLAAEFDIAERAYSAAVLRAAGALRRCYAIDEAAKREGFNLPSAALVAVACEFAAPAIGASSAAHAGPSRWSPSTSAGAAMVNIARREPGDGRPALAAELAELLRGAPADGPRARALIDGESIGTD